MISLLLACTSPSQPRPSVAHPNIVMVSLDTIRADHTTPYGYARDTTPVLSAVAAQGTTFQQAFSNGNESAYSHGALFSGRYASELADPTYATYAIPNTASLISEALSAYGYRTAAFTAGGHVTADFGFNQGWEQFSAEPSFASLWATTPKALAWIGQQSPQKPWFVFLHGYDAHRPYTRVGPWDHLYAQSPGSHLAEVSAASPCLSEMLRGHTLYPDLPPNWFSHQGGAPILGTDSYDKLENPPENTTKIPLSDADVQHIIDHYDGALRYEDTLLGLFLDQLQSTVNLENTVIILLSDHGEDMLDHGYINHRTGLYNSCTGVPLIVMGPGFAAGAKVNALVDGLDVAATVLALAGALPPAGSRGIDLREIAAGKAAHDAVFSEGIMDMVSVRTTTARMVYHHAALKDPHYIEQLQNAPLDATHFLLFDEIQDPQEQNNLLKSPSPEALALATTLRQSLVDWRQSLQLGSYLLPQSQVSPAVAQELRAHGYWDAENSKAPPPPLNLMAPPNTPPQPIPDTQCRDRLEFLSAQ